MHGRRPGCRYSSAAQAAADLPGQIETEIPLVEAPIEQDRDVKPQASALSPLAQAAGYYGGIDRPGCFLGMLGLLLACTVLYGAVHANLGIILLSQIVATPIALSIVGGRLHNIGVNSRLALLTFVPVANLFIAAKCILYPEGYYKTRKLDIIGKLIVCIFVGFSLLIIVQGVIMWRQA